MPFKRPLFEDIIKIDNIVTIEYLIVELLHKLLNLLLCCVDLQIYHDLMILL